MKFARKNVFLLQKTVFEMIDVLINLIVILISQCIHTSKIRLKILIVQIHFSFVKYTSIKLDKSMGASRFSVKIFWKQKGQGKDKEESKPEANGTSVGGRHDW